MNKELTKKSDWVTLVKKELDNLTNYIKVDADSDWKQFAQKLDMAS